MTDWFSPKRKLMYWCRMSNINGGTKPVRFALLAMKKWPELRRFKQDNDFDFAGLAKEVERLVRFERKSRVERQIRAAEAQLLRDRGLI